MKKLYTLALVLLCAFVGKAQIINIPDAAFKAKLLSADVTNEIASTETPFHNIYDNSWTVSSHNKIDTNNDGEIQVSEAQIIKYLKVTNSNITNLEGIVSFINIIYIDCNSNQLTTLNVQGLTNLQGLHCDSNQLPSLNVQGLTNLQYLNCNFNQLTFLNVQGLSNLQILYCFFNQLPSLNVQGLANLKDLNCCKNELPYINVQGLTNLRILACRLNQLTSLNVQGLTNLQNLDCSSNQISSLNFQGLANLQSLYCYQNQFTLLNVEELTNLINLDCSSNQLTELFIKNNGIVNWNYLGFSGNPSLNYICADEGDLTFVQQSVSNLGYTNCQVNSYCNFNPGGIYYTIQGNNNLDLNNNGCDASDSIYPNLKFNISYGTVAGSLISNVFGNYSIPVSAGNHTITPTLENPNYFTISPNNAIISFPTAITPFIQNFCIVPNGIHHDLEVVVIPITNARPGFDAVYKLIYKNKGTTTQSGTISFTFNDAVLDFVTANPAVVTQALNNLSWNFSNIVPLATSEIVLTFNVNSPTETPAVHGGDILPFTVYINGNANDESPGDNFFAYKQIVVNSFDPNEKVCLEGSTIAPEKVGDFVHYIIRFENDGTANAQNIVVKDMIDTTKFDIATLIPESGSASYTTRITNTNQVEFIFQDINLPFAAGSNTGYVAFKIKTKPTLVLGNTFSNTASIYFDYNFPINTNTATTTVQALATQDFDFSNYFTLYPNPAKSVLNISTKQSIEAHSLTIYNLLGQVVLAIPNAQNLNSVDVSSLKTGNYFLKITSDKGSATEKFMKE